MSNDSDESSNSHLPPVPIALVTQRFNNIKLEPNITKNHQNQQFYNKQFSTNQTTPRNSTSSSTQLASQTPLDNSTNKNCQTKVTRKIPPNIMMSNSDTSSSQGLSSDLSSSGINSGENTCNSGISGNISKLKPLKSSLKQNEQNVINRVVPENNDLIPELRLQKATPENAQNYNHHNNFQAPTITPVQKRNYGSSRMSQSSNNPRPMSIAIDERNLNATNFNNSSNPNTPNFLINSSMHDLTDPRKFRDDTGFSINMVEEGKNQQQQNQQVQFRKKSNNHNSITTPMGSIAKGKS